MANPRQFNQTGLRRRIPKWHWRDQTFGSRFWRSWFQMMLNLDMFFADDDGKKPWPPLSPFLLFYFAKYHVRQSDYFSSNKQTKNPPSQYPLLKNSWWIHEKSMMKKKSIKYKKIIDYRTTRHPSYVLKYDYIISSYYNFNQFNVFFPVRGWCIFFPFINDWIPIFKNWDIHYYYIKILRLKRIKIPYLVEMIFYSMRGFFYRSTFCTFCTLCFSVWCKYPDCTSCTVTVLNFVMKS